MSSYIFKVGACQVNNLDEFYSPSFNIVPSRKDSKPRLGTHDVCLSIHVQTANRVPRPEFQRWGDSSGAVLKHKNYQFISPQLALQAHSASPEIVAIISGFECHYVNDAIKKSLGYENEDWLGEHFIKFVHPEDKKGAVDFFYQYLFSRISNENIPTCRLRLMHKDSSKDFGHFELSFFDIEQFPSSNSSFTSPLGFIKGVAFKNINFEMMLQKKAKLSAHESSNTLATASQFLNFITEDLQAFCVENPDFQEKAAGISRMFDLAKHQVRSALQRFQSEFRTAHTGRFEINNQPTYLFNELTKFTEINTVINQGSGVEFIYSIDPKLENICLDFDMTFFLPILENTIKNSKRAILTKQRTLKQLSLTVKLRENLVNSLVIDFEIKDTGNGFGSNFIKQTFSQIFPNIKVVEHGYGLANSVERVHRLDSEMYITSNDNIGSIIEFTLNIMKNQMGLLPPSLRRSFSSLSTSSISSISSNCSTLAISSPRDCASGENFRFLVVDDNMLNRNLLVRFLERYNITCVHAENGLEAIEMCKKEKYHVIFMDFEMPLMDGIEACKAIRQDSMNLNHATQIWGLTGNCTDEDNAKGEQAGMNQVMVKPVKPPFFEKSMQDHFKEQTLIKLPSPTPGYRSQLKKQPSDKKFDKEST